MPDFAVCLFIKLIPTKEGKRAKEGRRDGGKNERRVYGRRGGKEGGWRESVV